MAQVTLTPANIRVGSGLASSSVTAGESVEPGDFLYASASKYYKAINTSEAAAAATHVALTYAALDEKVSVGAITPGTSYLGSSSAAWTKGETYVVGAVAGELMLASDVNASDWVTICGVAASTTSLQLYSTATGIEI